MSTTSTASSSKSSRKRQRSAEEQAPTGPKSHAKVPTEMILNAMTPESAMGIISSLDHTVLQPRGCWIPTVNRKGKPVKIVHGEYPRLTLNQSHKDLVTQEVRDLIKQHSGKTRIYYYQLAWRARGEQVPVYAEGKGFDISHACRRGRMNCPNAQGAQSCEELEFGCFNPQCLELITHADNLARARCTPIIECPYCDQCIEYCDHTSLCGSLDNRLNIKHDSQKEVASVLITYKDGTTQLHECP